MQTTLAEYYLREIDDWRSLIGIYLEEIREVEPLLQEVLQFDTVPNLAELTEKHLSALAEARRKLEKRGQQIDKLEPDFYNQKIPVPNEQVQQPSIDRMKALRKLLFTTERDYLKIKYYCDDFLADTIAIQYKPRSRKG